MLNAGKYSKKIMIYKTVIVTDDDGFQTEQKKVILTPYAYVRTTKGFTLIANNSDFEKHIPTSQFVIRKQRSQEIC